jgi:lysine-specific demethylase/histidyl-hydroxylase NO66
VIAPCVGEHSLHVTVSHGYRNQWYDYIKDVVLASLDVALKQHVDLRRGLPHDFTRYMGILGMREKQKQKGGESPAARGGVGAGGGGGAGEGPGDGRRADVEKTVAGLLAKVVACAPLVLDEAADSRARAYVRERLPPLLSQAPHDLVRGDPEKEGDDEAQLEAVRDKISRKLTFASRIRLHRQNSARVKAEGELCVLYHAANNSRDYHGKEEQALEFDIDYMQALNQLIQAYPAYVRVRDLLMEGEEEDKLQLAQVLASNGIIARLDPPPKKP